jgi:mannose-6-phosphate isomerase-like protein (cupin superfamily)
VIIRFLQVASTLSIKKALAMKTMNKQQSPRYERDGITSYLLVSESTCGASSITTTLVEMSPGGKQHIHEHATEQSYFILSGKGEITVGGEKKMVKPGDSIFIPSNAPHGLVNTGKNVLTYFSAGSPPFGKESERKLWPLAPIDEKD